MLIYKRKSVEPTLFLLENFDTFSILELCNSNQSEEFMTGFIFFIKNNRQCEFFYMKAPQNQLTYKFGGSIVLYVKVFPNKSVDHIWVHTSNETLIYDVIIFLKICYLSTPEINTCNTHNSMCVYTYICIRMFTIYNINKCVHLYVCMCVCEYM